MTRYFFNGEYYDSWYFVVAEVLDARVYKGLDATSMESGFDLIKEHMCSREEIRTNNGALSDNFLAKYGAVQAERTQYPVDIEIVNYYNMMKSYEPSNDNFKFWQGNKSLFPILYKKARYIFRMCSTSSDVERLFSTGNICTPKRNRISPAHLEMIVMLRHWLMEDQFNDARSKNRLSAIYKILHH